ncbi:polysaccharide biosynthesis/export family protein [Henriciella sp. AS95]|uniref:polysaccharide biosynthesis/export family protein n=1 Tax=Henriciella sp. AS95 TaxID=3135782 RepID=UPI00317C95C8
MPKLSVQIFLGALLCWVLAACQAAPIISQQQAPAEGTIAERAASEYTLGPADKMRVTVFNEPELSGEFVVDGQGYVSMPLIGEVDVNGLTVRQFQRLTEQKLAEGFLREPRVSAEVTNYRPYYILGEIARPGEYPYTNGLTVMNAIATAEGFTYRANRKVIMIKGVDDNQEFRIELTPTTKVQPGDTIRVVERFF